MPTLQPYIFTGATTREAHAALNTAIADGSMPLLMGPPTTLGLWITHREVIPGAMQQAYYELHVTAWVEVPEEPPAEG